MLKTKKEKIGDVQKMILKMVGWDIIKYHTSLGNYGGSYLHKMSALKLEELHSRVLLNYERWLGQKDNYFMKVERR